MVAQEHIDETLEAVDAPPPESEQKPDSPPHLSGLSWRYALKRSVREFSTDGGTDLAAMLTYYTVLSLAPAMLAVFSIISLLLANDAESVTSWVENFVRDSVPAEYQDLVVDLVENVTGSQTGGVIALIIGIATALWSASAYVKAFSRSSNTIYGREEGRGLIMQTGTMLLTTLAMLIGIVLILVALALNETVVSTLLGPVAEPLGLGETLEFLLGYFLPVWAWVKWPVILLLLIVLVAVLYYFTPNVRQPKFRWLSLGSAVAIIGIGLAGVALYLYLSYFAGYSSYGTIGTVMALLFALWVFNMVLLLGVEIDAEVERARQLQAGIGAEENIQLPPRETGRVEKMRRTREKLAAEGRELREMSDTDDTNDTDDTTREGEDTRDGATERTTAQNKEDAPSEDRQQRPSGGDEPPSGAGSTAVRR